MSFRMPYRRVTAIFSTLLAAALVAGLVRKSAAAPDFPVPSVYRIAWELNFTHGLPKRMSIDVPGEQPKAYWFMTYTVTNEGDKEQNFYPKFEILTDDGKVSMSDQKIPKDVFEAIKTEIGNHLLEQYTAVNGPIRLGPAEARDCVAIWPETVRRMEHFSIFVTGLSGEFLPMTYGDDGNLVKVTDALKLKELEEYQQKKEQDKADHKENNDPDKLIILRKTMQLNYFIRGDDVYPGEDEVNQNAEEWIMR